MKSPRKLLLFAAIFTVLLAALFLPIEQLLTGIQNWVESHPSSAFGVLLGGIALGTLLLLPTSLLTMLAGFLFGLSKGLLVVWLAAVIASSFAFWLSRSAARPWVERKVHRRPLYLAIDRAIQRKGLLVVMLTRLVMFLPYPLLNYSLGLTSVRFRDFALGSGLGSIPPFFLFVYLGTTVSDVAAIINGTVQLEDSDLLLGSIGLAVVIAVVLIIVRAAGKVLREELVSARK